MPYRKRKRAPSRKRPYRKRRSRRRRLSIPQMLRTTGMNGTHMVRQKTFTNLTIGNVGFPQFEQFQYAINNIPQVATFQRLYDRYTIYAVSTRIVMNSYQPPSLNLSFSAAISIDRDSVVATPPNWDSFIERGNTRMKTMTTGYKGANELFWRQKPKPLSRLYESTISDGFQILPSSKPVWIDMADPTVPHYGALVGFNNAAGVLNEPISCTVITTYFLGFQGIQ